MTKTISFIHVADIHLDAWRESKLKMLNFESFSRIVDIAIERKVDFVLFSGDILDKSVPSLNAIRYLTQELIRLKDHNIEVFAIPGSHDLSSDESSYLYVLEDARLLNITSNGEEVDNKTIRLLPTVYKDVVIYGILGRRGSIDREIYTKKLILKDIEKHHDKLKIFQFHIGISELLGKNMQFPNNISLSQLPKGLDYYAGGHIHTTVVYKTSDLQNRSSYVVYPGPVYVSNFEELEEMRGRSNYVYVRCTKNDDGWNLDVKHEFFVPKGVEVFDINCNALTPEEVRSNAMKTITSKDLKDKIVLLRFRGVVKGYVSNINFREIEDLCMEKGAYVVKKNISALESEEFVVQNKEILEDEIGNIEKQIIMRNLEGNKDYPFDAVSLMQSLLDVLSEEKSEDESKEGYKKRVVGEGMKKIEQLIFENSRKEG